MFLQCSVLTSVEKHPSATSVHLLRFVVRFCSLTARLPKMVFSYDGKVIIKYLREKYGHGPTRIIDDHPEYPHWNINGVKMLLKKIDETGEIKRSNKASHKRSWCLSLSQKREKQLFISWRMEKLSTRITIATPY